MKNPHPNRLVRLQSGNSSWPRVTCVVTSCGRHDLLTKTLESFSRYCDIIPEVIIIVEDGSAPPNFLTKTFPELPLEVISTGSRVGQIAAIDHAYSRVSSPYIFHLEDDWEFYRSGFMEKSLAILEHNPRCIQVQIRALSDTNRHPVDPEVYNDGDIYWQKMSRFYNYNGVLWHGFSFNPGLRRLSDYNKIGDYGNNVKFDFKIPWDAECKLSRLYFNLNYFAAILSDSDGIGYVRHLGRHRRVPPPSSFPKASNPAHPESQL